MRTLLLWRHAKSCWEDSSLPDHDRPLAARGRDAAPRIGAWMREHDLAPDLILCSTAVRARETLRLARPSLLATDAPVRELKTLYLASPSQLFATVRRLPEEAGRVLVVGHNPGLERFALQLAGDGKGKALRRMGKKFPTAALAELTFAEGAWRDVEPGSARLESFVRPRDLA